MHFIGTNGSIAEGKLETLQDSKISIHLSECMFLWINYSMRLMNVKTIFNTQGGKVISQALK